MGVDVVHGKLAIKRAGKSGVVADKEQRSARVGAFPFEQCEKFEPGVGVERGGGLVRDHQVRPTEQGTRSRDALLLTHAERGNRSRIQFGVIEAQGKQQSSRFTGDIAAQARGPLYRQGDIAI